MVTAMVASLPEPELLPLPSEPEEPLLLVAVALTWVMTPGVLLPSGSFYGDPVPFVWRGPLSAAG